MKTRFAFVLASLFLGSSVVASAGVSFPDHGVMKPVNAVISAANSSDSQALLGLYSRDAVVIDDAAPYRWTGAGAGKDWLLSISGFGKLNGAQFKAARPTEMQFSGDRAYVVVPVLLQATNPAKPFREAGVLAFTLRKAGGAWRITSQAWSIAASPAGKP